MNSAIRKSGRPALIAAGLAMTFTNIASAAPERRVTLPIGTVIPVKLDQTLNSKVNMPGDKFTATVRNGLDDGALPDGTRFEGVVREALPMANGKPGVLDVEFRNVVFPGNDRRAIEASLYTLDGKMVKSSDGRLVATSDKGKDRLKWVGIGAGAGALISVLTKGNTLVDSLLGAGAGYLFNELQGKKAADVNLKQGAEFGIRLDRQLAFSTDDRSYYRSRGLAQDGRTPYDRDRDDRYYNPDRDRDRGNSLNDRDRDRDLDRRDVDRRDYDRRDRDRGSNDIGVMLDNREVRFRGGARPYERNGVVMVPLEAFSRTANFDYRYDADARTVYARNRAVRLNLDSRVAFVDGQRRRLPAMAEVKNGVVYVPMQFLGWAAQGSSSWDSASRTVIVTTDRDR